MIRVYAPATSANLNIGFDSLGVALRPLDHGLGDEISIELTHSDNLTITGPYAHEIKGVNIVKRALTRVRELTGRREPVSLELYKGMPVGSGLGSSAASVVAAVIACDEVYGAPLGEADRLCLMGELEAELSGGIHWDNILPCALGGLRLSSVALPVPANWLWLVAYPGIRLETKAMRALLPASVPFAEAVESAARFARFVDALHRGEGREAAALMVDTFVEPKRAPMIPGFDEVMAQMRACGSIATGISGSGPTIFSLFDDPVMAKAALEPARAWTLSVANTMKGAAFSTTTGTASGAFACLCTVDEAGARLIRHPGKEQ